MTTLTEFSIHKDDRTINWVVQTEFRGDVHLYRDVDGCAGVDFIAIDPEAFEAIAAALLAAAQERRRFKAMVEEAAAKATAWAATDPIVVQFPRTLRSETRHGT